MIGKRLLQARSAAGLSLRELEDRIQNRVTAQAIGRYERDEIMPSSDVLLVLAAALGVGPDFLLSQRKIELQQVDFRKAAAAAAKDLMAVEARVLDQVERYLEIEEALPDAERPWSRPTDRRFIITSVDQAEDAAMRLRELWALGEDAIPQLAELLEDRGIKVIATDLPINVDGTKALVRAERHADIPVVVVNATQNGERQRFTMAHELAHAVLHLERLGEAEQEGAANRFAGAFLVPAVALRRQLGQHRTSVPLYELVDLKAIFGVSVAALVHRVKQAGIVNDATSRRMWAEVRRLRLNQPDTEEPNKIVPEKPQRMERLCLRALAEDVISEAKAASLLRIRARDLDAKRQLIPPPHAR